MRNYFTGILESHGVTSANRVVIDVAIHGLVNLFAFSVVNYGHTHVLQFGRGGAPCN